MRKRLEAKAITLAHTEILLAEVSGLLSSTLYHGSRLKYND